MKCHNMRYSLKLIDISVLHYNYAIFHNVINAIFGTINSPY